MKERGFGWGLEGAYVGAHCSGLVIPVRRSFFSSASLARATRFASPQLFLSISNFSCHSKKFSLVTSVPCRIAAESSTLGFLRPDPLWSSSKSNGAGLSHGHALNDRPNPPLQDCLLVTAVFAEETEAGKAQQQEKQTDRERERERERER